MPMFAAAVIATLRAFATPAAIDASLTACFFAAFTVMIRRFHAFMRR